MYNENVSTPVRIPGPTMSKLLGISLLEFYNLKHEVAEHTDDFGNVYEYTIRIHPDNNRELLSKIKLPDDYVLKFDVESVFPDLVAH
jgi:hypothetical protein